MLFRRITAVFLCAVAICFAASDSDSGEDMMIFKAILQSPIFKDNFVQSCSAQSVEWLGADQADKTCNCAFDRMVKDNEFINRILSSMSSNNIEFEKWGFDFIEPCIPQSYPAETDNAFVKECLKSGDMDKATCECMLSSIKKDYTVHELMKTAFEDQKKLEANMLIKAAQCLSK